MPRSTVAARRSWRTFRSGKRCGPSRRQLSSEGSCFVFSLTRAVLVRGRVASTPGRGLGVLGVGCAHVQGVCHLIVAARCGNALGLIASAGFVSFRRLALVTL